MILLLLAALLPAAPAGAADGVVRDIRIGRHPDKVRFVIDLSRPLEFRIFSIPDPYRVVIDLPEVEFAPGAERESRPAGPVSGYRFGLLQPGTSRIVIDAVEPVSVVSAFALPADAQYGPRLVVDLKKVGRAAFLAESDRSLAARENRPQPAMRPAEPVQPPVLARPERRPKDRIVVAIDAGHGGVDPGTIGASGAYEKDVVLNAARVLKRELERSGRYQVLLTRDRDVFLPLRERIAVARRGNADIFLSLHADSIPSSNLRGASVYTLSETASDKEAELLASNENKSDIIAGINFQAETPEVTSILIDLAQRETMNHSARFAGILVRELGAEVTMLRTAHRFAGFAVLKAPDVPSVLVELGYLSNRQDEKLLMSDGHLQKVARSLRRSLDRYFDIVQEAARSG